VSTVGTGRTVGTERARMSVPPAPAGDFDLDSAWTLHPSVSVRPEPFGALLYHFGNRRLSFLKTRQLLEIVERLGKAPDARTACLEAGAEPAQLPTLARALAALAAGETIRRRESGPEAGTESGLESESGTKSESEPGPESEEEVTG
jgi:mycofactocin biosynthesis protein MftB